LDIETQNSRATTIQRTLVRETACVAATVDKLMGVFQWRFDGIVNTS
jgi:hypothetical protein